MDKEYACGPCRTSRKVSYPRESPVVIAQAKKLGLTLEEVCPELPWHSICPDCGNQMLLVPEGMKLKEYHMWYRDLFEKHHGPLEIPDPKNRIDIFGVYAELEKRQATNKADANSKDT